MAKKSLLSRVVFSLVMVLMMVYGMIVYNIVISTGEFSTDVFTMTLKELPIMAPIALIVELVFVERIAVSMAFKIVNPTDEPLLITIMISLMMVMIMCPTMSLIATALFKTPSAVLWGQAWAKNLPVALIWQLLVCGPIVRFIFSIPERISNKEVNAFS